jgi:hypothetical protein
MLDALHETYTMLVAFFLAARFFMGFYYLVLSYTVPMVRGMMIVQAMLTFIPGVLWIASVHIEKPNRYAAIWIAIIIDLCGAMVVVLLIRGAKKVSKRLGDWTEQVFEFYPAVNIEHKVRRHFFYPFPYENISADLFSRDILKSSHYPLPSSKTGIC